VTFRGLSEIADVDISSPATGVIFARARLSYVEDVSFLRSATQQWDDFSTGNQLPQSLFNWVSVFNFNSATDTKVLCLHVPVGLKPRAEALMLVRHGHVVRCDRHHRAPLVYVGFLEVAPWNGASSPSRVFAGLGPVMLRYAFDLSVHMGYEGRVGLHSVTAAEAFYRKVGFRSFDCPSEHHELYMEIDGTHVQSLIGD
jgi:hypothetical protein